MIEIGLALIINFITWLSNIFDVSQTYVVGISCFTLALVYVFLNDWNSEWVTNLYTKFITIFGISQIIYQGYKKTQKEFDLFKK